MTDQTLGKSPQMCIRDRLGGDGVVGEHADPDFPAALDVAHHGDTGGFDLLVGQLSVLHSLQTDVAEGDGGAAQSGPCLLYTSRCV